VYYVVSLGCMSFSVIIPVTGVCGVLGLLVAAEGPRASKWTFGLPIRFFGVGAMYFCRFTQLRGVLRWLIGLHVIQCHYFGHRRVWGVGIACGSEGPLAPKWTFGLPTSVFGAGAMYFCSITPLRGVLRCFIGLHVIRCHYFGHRRVWGVGIACGSEGPLAPKWTVGLPTSVSGVGTLYLCRIATLGGVLRCFLG
jgi:hypothetical protein